MAKRKSSNLDGRAKRRKLTANRRVQQDLELPEAEANQQANELRHQQSVVGPNEHALEVQVTEANQQGNKQSSNLDGRPKRRKLAANRRVQHQQQDLELPEAEANQQANEHPHQQSVVGPPANFVARVFPPDVLEFSLGKLDRVCKFCEALRFPGEANNCCHNGKVSLPAPRPFPPEFRSLFLRESPQSNNFFDNIRRYNSAMSFASFGAQIAPPPGHGPYCFRIHGQIYHRSSSLYPDNGATPSYSQLYIIEGDQAVQARMNHTANQMCQRDIMVLLSIVLDRVSPYAAAYKFMHHVEQEQMQLARNTGSIPPTVTMHFKEGTDVRRYNEPRHDEVAAIFVSNDGAPPKDRDIVVYPRDEPPRNISYMSSHSDPMVYPLFFPGGDLGWYSGMLHNPANRTQKRVKVTQLQFYSHRLAVRANFSPLFYGGKLFQQYIVDSYVKTEAARLDFIRRKQKDLRVELYQGLMDHINSQAAQHNLTPGKMVILPSSFQGSPRAMQQNYQDAMAIVSKFGKPDLFLTITSNPKCKDIMDNLDDGQRAEQRPDIVARVFKNHLKELQHDITEKHVLGIPVAHIYVIEFQKRGLPHAHMLIMLANGSKLNTSEDIDTVISAEIPDPVTQPQLFNIVKSSMIHGPCGVLNRNSVCMADGKCTKDYPKEFREATALALNGYPHYRRRDNGRTITVRSVEVNNQWVVPYNPYLTLKFNAHINVEACTTMKSVKYLFKYIYKGHDCANIQVTASNELTHDEVTTFLDARYVSAPEAFWRLSEYKLHDKSHSIVRLPVHLPRQQPVYFEPGKHVDAANKSANQDTMLTAFFKYNALNSTQYTYNEFPNHFVFEHGTRKWRPRKQRGNRIIARLYSVSPRDTERFCLRLLLLHVPGPTSFQGLRTVGGHVADSYKEACALLDLVTDDTSWDKTLAEASMFYMPSQLRSLFATICLYCEPSDPLSLWVNHKDALVEDFVQIQGLTPHDAEQRALQNIESVLQQSGVSCIDYGLPSVIAVSATETFDHVREALTASTNIALLNEDQRLLVDEVLQAVQDFNCETNPQCRAYFLDGPGGTGKTMIYNTLIAQLRSMDLKVASCAWTGIAATLLSGGRTCHNLFKLPVPILDTSVCNVKPTSVHANFLCSVTMFIIDEASMVPCHALSAIDKMLRDITGIDVPFGGKIFLLGGDFRQVLPVVPRSPRTVIVENCIKSSPLWPLFTVFKLTRNMRAGADQHEFAEWLLRLGDGNLECPGNMIPDSIQIPPQCNIVLANIVSSVFPNVTDPKMLSNTVILTSTNDNSLAVNNEVLKKLPGQCKVFLSSDQAVCDNEEESNNYQVEFLNSLTPSGMPPHKLMLKCGAIIMLLRNLDINKGLCNGTRLIVHRLHSHVLDAEILTGSNKGNRVLIPRITLAPSDVTLPFTLKRVQFPIRLAYSMTINKSQGQTFDTLGIYLPAPVFSHGQLYVAFSRARSFSNVHVQLGQTNTQGVFGGMHVTQNIVYKEVL